MTDTTQSTPFKTGDTVDAIMRFAVQANPDKNTKPGIVCEVLDTKFTVFVDEMELVDTPKVGDRLQVTITNSWKPRHKPSRNPDGLNWFASQRQAHLNLQKQELAAFYENRKSLFRKELVVVLEEDKRNVSSQNHDPEGVWASITLPEYGKKVRVYMNPRTFDDHNLEIPVGNQIRVIVESDFTTFANEWVLKATPVLLPQADGTSQFSLVNQKEIQA